MIDLEAIIDEAGDQCEEDEAVGAEAIEITADVFRNHLVAHLRAKKMEYEANNNHVSAMTIAALLRELG